MPPATDAYARRIHRVIDHVRSHLSEDLSLAAVAPIAGFSPFHFHRVFKAVAGETLAAFTRRARLERAVALMRSSADRELGAIAMEVGFGSHTDFCRVFRRYYGVAPGHWDRTSRLDAQPGFVTPEAKHAADWEPPTVEVRQRPACRVLYVRVTDPWRGNNLARGYARLVERVTARGLDHRRARLIGASWDNELTTPIEKLVYDLGLTVPAHVRAEGDFGIHEFAAGPAAEIHCTQLVHTAIAWERLYEWLPSSGHEPADVPALKRFRRTPSVFDHEAWNVDCSIALAP